MANHDKPFPLFCRKYKVIDKVFESGGALGDVPIWTLPFEEAFLYYTWNLVVDPELDDRCTLFVLNFRDSRDLVNGQHYWQFFSSNSHARETGFEELRQEISSTELDTYACNDEVQVLNEPIIENLYSLKFIQGISTTHCAPQPCFDAKSMYTDSSKIFCYTQSVDAELVRTEHPGNLAAPRAGIGSKWRRAEFVQARARMDFFQNHLSSLLEILIYTWKNTPNEFLSPQFFIVRYIIR